MIIKTRFISPTNYKPSRIGAVSDCGHRLTVPVDYSLEGTMMHHKAAEALARKIYGENCYVIPECSHWWKADRFHRIAQHPAD